MRWLKSLLAALVVLAGVAGPAGTTTTLPTSYDLSASVYDVVPLPAHVDRALDHLPRPPRPAAIGSAGAPVSVHPSGVAAKTASGLSDDVVGLATRNITKLSNRWYAVVNDVAVILGDVLIERCPGLAWEFFTKGGKSDVAYQKHVITGFTKAPNAKFNLDVDRLVATYAYQIVAGATVPEDYFVKLLAAGQLRA